MRERPGMICQHKAPDQAITSASDSHVEQEERHDAEGDDGSAGALVPRANGPFNGLAGGDSINRTRPR